MYEKSKMFVICPICGAQVEMFQHSHYICNKCYWNSLENTVDISYSDPLSAPLSNLFPHKFTIYDHFHPERNITCLSIESFIQSLRVEEPELQKQICENYSGYMAWKLRLSLRDWRSDGLIYWRGITMKRNSKEYTSLITMAYDSLFDRNIVFRELVLPTFKDKILIHSIGCDNPEETLLTEMEYRYQLNRLIERLEKDQSTY